MFIDRSAGALARPHLIARLATVAAALLVALIFLTSYQQALAHDGHDHDAAPAAVPQTAFSSMSVPLSATEGSSVNTEYFPAQFKNQSRRTTPEEHIQAY